MGVAPRVPQGGHHIRVFPPTCLLVSMYCIYTTGDKKIATQPVSGQWAWPHLDVIAHVYEVENPKVNENVTIDDNPTTITAFLPAESVTCPQT